MEQPDASFDTAKVNGRSGNVVHTDRGDLEAPVVVDALGWRRVWAMATSRPTRRCQGLEVHPWGAGDEMEIWIDRRYVFAGYGWSFPAADELRIGVGSFDPRFHVKDTTVLLAEDLRATRSATRATGSRTSCARRPRTASSSSATRPGTACR